MSVSCVSVGGGRRRITGMQMQKQIPTQKDPEKRNSFPNAVCIMYNPMLFPPMPCSMRSLTAGQLTASLTVAILMNSKEYLGTFDWGLGYDGIHVLALILCVALLLVTFFFIEEPKRRQPQPEQLKLRRSDTVKLNLKDSWKMVKHGAFMGILMFGFTSSMMVHVQTTAAPMVRSRWAGVKVLPQQLLLGHNI